MKKWKELRDVFPLQCLSNSKATNSDYCNVAEESRDSYMSSASWKIEQTFYSNRISRVKDCSDLYVVNDAELCYDDIICSDCYHLLYSLDCKNCVDSYFLYDCRNCLNCFMCRQNFNFKIYNSDGNYLLDCKNCHNCNTISESEDCYNCVRNGWLKSSIDVSGSMHLEL